MPTKCFEIHGTKVLECSREGDKLASERDAIDLIGEAFQHDATLILIPVERLTGDFFRLRTGLAGAMIQKFAIYGRCVAVIGDISMYVAESLAFRDFVNELNRGNQIWFCPNLDSFVNRMEKPGG